MNVMSIFPIILGCLLSYSHSSADPKKTDTKNYRFPPCQSCKILVKSFKDGLERTSRGKLEGGDAAWEKENKLSYAKSEIRLIEIIEKVCSEVDKGQHQCHSLAEENESLFEEWWQNQDTYGDIHSWMCIDKLKLCCPEEHFGPECTPCAGFPKNICNNNGKCKGSGTRKGNGECSCNIGYEGASCETCAQTYFESYKDDEKLLCSPCHQSCQHTCTQAGPKGCLACKSGWVMDSERGCNDVNECLTLMHVCSTKQFCVNNEGSYSCLDCDRACARCDGDGPDMCLECAEGFHMNGNICEDSSKKASERTLNFARYITYFGLCVATCIVFQRNTFVASLIGLAVALYISISEYMLTSGKATSDVNYNIGSIFQSV